jgi:magnesium-transporting ATPase (P-type)
MAPKASQHNVVNSHTAIEFVSLSADECLDRLVTSRAGLSLAEANARLRTFGRNTLPRARHAPWWIALGSNFVHLFAVLLWIAALLAMFAGMPELTLAIVLVVIINGLFSYWQQYRAQQAVEALESLLPRRVSVRRGGAEVAIDVVEVALGDILTLSEGTAIPADARVIADERFRVDTSTLTGESRPVTRIASPAEIAGKTASEMSNIVLAGTLVVSGRAEVVVFATGENTEFGRLASLTHDQPHQLSPLQSEIQRMTRTITVMALAMGLVFFALGAGLGRLTLVEGFLFALGIIVANVPEGLLPTISLALALGVRRMAARKAIVKRLERVEALGAVTVIVTDKTGTLTKNQMTVRRIWCGRQEHEVTGTGYDQEGLIQSPDISSSGLEDVATTLRVAALCCDARLIPPSHSGQPWQAIGDPTEAALLVAAKKAGITDGLLARFPRLAELPFDSVRKRMTTIQQSDSGPIACVKGAPSEVLPRCSRYAEGQAVEFMNDMLRSDAEEAGRRLAGRGLRVLAIAQRSVPDCTSHWADSEVEQELTFLGLVAMEDPPREEVASALRSCKSAGIRVIMATGDDGWTAQAIGQEISLYRDATRVITGAEVDAMPDHTLAMVLGDPQVLFARVSPVHKLRLVETLQRRGEVVALTGDGVNDAPALKRADIGVAMGASGTDVAREAADMILLDDNFATIVAAIEEGRAVYENVRKFVTYIFASNVPEIVPFIAFVLFRIPLPLTIMQILAVDLGTDLLPALALGTERPEPRIMQSPPRRRDQRLLDRPTLIRAYGWLGMIEAVLGLIGFFFVYWWAGWRPGEPLTAVGPLYLMATTMSLAGIVACQIGNGLACRSKHESILTPGPFSNQAMLLAIVAEIVLLLLLIYVAPLAHVFHLAPLEPVHWLLLATFGPLLLFAEECRKAVARTIAQK